MCLAVTETDAGPPALSHSDLTLKTEHRPNGERKQSGEKGERREERKREREKELTEKRKKKNGGRVRVRVEEKE